MDPSRKLSTRICRLWTGSIRNRLILGISALLAIVMSVFVVDMGSRQADYLHRESQEEATVLAQTLAANSVSWALASDLAGLQEVVQVLKGYPDVRYAMVLARDGKVLAHTDPRLPGRYARDPVSDSLLRAPLAPQLLVNTASLVDVAAPIQANGALIGWARVSLSQDRVDDDLRAIARNGIIYAAIAVVLGILLAVALTRGLTRDLTRLVKAARRIGAGERGVQSSLAREDELGELSGALDGMSSDLDRAGQALREREATIGSLVDKSPLAMLVASGPEQRVEIVNDKFIQLFGYTIEEMPDVAHWWPLAYPQEQYREEIKAKWSERVARAIETRGEIEPLEARVRCKDGSLRYVEFRLSSIGAKHLVTFVDLTERKRTEQAALEQFKLAEAFFNHSVSGLVILDRNFNFVRVNEAYARACRKEIGEFAGRNHFEMYPSDTQAIFEEVVRSKCPYATFTRAFVYPDQPERGTTYWDWTLVPILDQQGEVEHLVFSLQEVTERKRAEDALQRSEASLKEAQRIAHLGNWELDLVGNVLIWTDEIYRIFEIDPKKFGASYEAFLNAIHPDDREFVDRIYTESVKSKTPYDIVHRLLMKDGRVKFVNERCETYYDPAGRPLRSIGTVQDVTERKRAEEMRTQLAAIVQSSHDAIIGKDLAGIITSWNPGAEKVYGYRAEEVLGKQVAMLAPEGRKDEIEGLLERVRRGEAVMNFETERFRKDGVRIDISIDLSPIRDASGRIVGASTIARDITEKKQAERALLKVNRALKALSSCNEALIHATEEKRLLDEICRIIVDIEGYRLAWVGYVEHDAQQTVRPVAQCGYEIGYLEHAAITWADNERGGGPLGIAIRSGRIQVVQDVSTDPRFAPWRANAARLGYGSVLVAPLVADSRVIGALSIHAEGADAFDAGEIALLSELAADMAFGIVTLRTRGAHEQSAERLQRSMEATVQVIASTVEMRDPYTAGHQRRVAELATAIARELGLSEDQVHAVHLAGVVHDLGKIHIPAEILSKPGRLSAVEFELIKSHPEAGYDILKGVDFPWPIAQIVFQHHERLDGSGYPRGLEADEILLEARILTVADVVEAMSSHRPYRPSLGVEPALQEISAKAGRCYDADVVRACLALFREKGFAFKA